MFSNAKYLDSRSLRVYCSQKYLEVPSVGIITSKKLGGAVVRNRAKRRLREIVRKIAVDIPSDSDLIFIVKKAFCKTTSELIELEIRLLLSKIKNSKKFE